MVAQSDPVYGREPVIKLVRELMAREEVGGSLRNQHFPILVVEGFRGAGKTALLSALEDLLDQRVPHAKLDFEATSGASITQVLSGLAFELSGKCRRYGALRFPRFIIGQLVMGLDLDLKDHAQARGQVIEVLERRRWVDTIRAELVDMAGTVLKTLGESSGAPVEPPRTVFGLALKWLTARAPARIVLGSFQGWYGHRDLGLANDSIDMLVNLNRWARNKEDKGSRQRVDELLLAAFLADLRTEFDRGRRADERSLNCVVLLDNADSRLGRRFLNELVRARRQRAAGEQHDADPLTVVATSRERLLAGVPSADWETVPLHNTRSEQRPGKLDWSRLWWLRYQLPGLTEDEISRAVATSVPATVDNQRVTRVFSQLTDGHPASIRLVLDAVARNPPVHPIEPEVTLSQPPSGEDSDRWPTVEDQMLDRLLDVSNAKSPLQDLVTCTAARELPHALALAAQDDLVVSDQVKFLENLEPILWPADQMAGLALPRRLLQRRLARRDPAVAPSWSQVYGRLRDACRTKDGETKGDEAGELYYALAAGELGS